MSNIDKQAVQAVADLKAGYTLGHADVEIIQQMALDAVTLMDELEAAERRIAELEARTATLPENITSANAPEVFEISSEAERLGLRGTYASYAVGWNARGMADKEALRAASICIDGES